MNTRTLWASGLEKIEADTPLTKEEKEVRYLIDSDYINLRKKVRVNNG